jgi:hypothetical protein
MEQFFYSDFKRMVVEQKPDGVIVCVSPKVHAMMATEIMRLGYPVYTENPPAESATEALTVARVAKETGLLCTTAFKKRYNRSYAVRKSGSESFRRKIFSHCRLTTVPGPMKTSRRAIRSCWISPSM